MPEEIPEFRPENYPRVYKPRFDQSAAGVILGSMALFIAIANLINLLDMGSLFNMGTHWENVPLDLGSFDWKHIWHEAKQRPLYFAGTINFVAIFGVTGILGIVSVLQRVKLTAGSIESGLLSTHKLERSEIEGARIETWDAGFGRPAVKTILVPKDKTRPSLAIPVAPAFIFDDAYDAWVGNLPFLGGDKYVLTGVYLRTPIRFGPLATPVEWRNHQWRPVDAPPPKPEKGLVTPNAILVAFGLPAFIIGMLYLAPSVLLIIVAVIVLYAAYLLCYIMQKVTDKKG